ncbi:MAG: hypothetical protein ABII00_10655 [Elusimicrobiota bacterium]
MSHHEHFPTPEELSSAPICDRADSLKFYSDESAKRRKKGEPGPLRMLMPAARFAELVDALADFKPSPRLLDAWASLGLISPPLEREGRKDLFVYPDHFEQAAVVLTLRYCYHLPLKAIRDLLAHFPHDLFHVVTSRKLSADELLDAAKMLPGGFELKDIFMARACDAMLGDLLPADEALQAAAEEGGRLRKLEEERILSRLDEIKAWVTAGGRQKFVQREAARDFQDLAWRQRLAVRVRKKLLARQARIIRDAAAKGG